MFRGTNESGKLPGTSGVFSVDFLLNNDQLF